MKIITILTAAALGLTATATIAQTTTTVHYADLNMDSDAGKAALVHRIAHAADKVCDRANGVVTLGELITTRTCREKAMADAMKQVEAKLAPRYAAR